MPLWYTINSKGDFMFDQILDKDENIIEMIKPDKARTFWGSVIGSLFIFIFIFIFSCLTIFVPSTSGESINYLYMIIPFGIYAVLLLLILIFTNLWYKKTAYAYTNKRIIIRTGIIGVDFKALDLKMIGAINVNVSLVDKIVRHQTGSLKFGSMSSPMALAGNSQSVYAFVYVKNPYEVYRKLKEIIEESKK